MKTFASRYADDSGKKKKSTRKDDPYDDSHVKDIVSEFSEGKKVELFEENHFRHTTRNFDVTGRSIFQRFSRHNEDTWFFQSWNFSASQEPMSVEDLGVTKNPNDPKSSTHTFHVIYTHSYNTRDFDLEFFDIVFGAGAGVVITNYIEGTMKSKSKTLEDYWNPGEDANGNFLNYDRTDGKPKDVNITLDEDAYLVYQGLISGAPVQQPVEAHSTEIQKILADDRASEGEDAKKNRLLLQQLILQVSPEEWEAGGIDFTRSDEMLIWELTAYLKYRGKLIGKLNEAMNNKDAKTATELINPASVQVLIGLPIEMRLQLIRFLAENVAEERDLAIIKLMQTAPFRDVARLVGGLTENKSELLRLVQKATLDHEKEFGEVCAMLAVQSISIPDLMTLIINNTSGQPVDGKNRFPWSAPMGLALYFGESIAYQDVKFTDEGKIKGNYIRYHTEDQPASIYSDYQPPPKIVFHETGKPEDQGSFELEPFQLITLVLEHDEEELGMTQGQEAVVPAIMLIYLSEAMVWNQMVSILKVALNVAMLGVGVGVLAAAKTFWVVIDGLIITISSAIAILSDVIKELPGGKEFLRYFELFNYLSLGYFGIRILTELPQVIAGVVKMWRMFQKTNAGDAKLIELAGVDTGIESLNVQLQEYIKALDQSRKAEVLASIAAEQARLEITFAQTVSGGAQLVDPAVSMARFLRDQIVKGLLNAEATIQQIKTFVLQQSIYAELAKMTDAELTILVTSARAELDSLLFVAVGQEERYYQIASLLSEEEKVIFSSWAKLTTSDATAQELMFDYLIGDGRTITGLFEKFGLETNAALRKKVFDYINLNNSNSLSIISAETMLYSATDVKALETIVNSDVTLKYLFRGTSEGYGGGGNALAETTSTSTDPTISTIFALNSEALAPGNGILMVSEIQNLAKTKVAFPNVLSESESEVALSILPSEFSKLPGIRTAKVDDARNILMNMGFDMPAATQVATRADVSKFIQATPRMTPEQINEFYLQLFK